MKIAVPAKGNNLDAELSPLLGMAPYILIVDKESMSCEAIPNPVPQSERKPGPQTMMAYANFILSRGVNVVITGTCGPILKYRLTQMNIEIVDGRSGKVRDVVAGYGRTEETPIGPGYIFSGAGLIIILLLLLPAIWFGQTVIVVMLVLVLMTAIFSKLWSYFSLHNMYCYRYLSNKRAFPGEYIEIKLKVENRKALPLPWLRLDDEIPTALVGDIAGVTESYPGFSLISNTSPLLWYRSISWRHRLQCTRRGYYALGPMTVSSSDILGFYPRSERQRIMEHVIVYPKLYPVTRLGLSSLYPLGETRAERYIFEDPTRTIGVRDYTFQDSLRHIHWKASARHQQLQVKVFEPTTTLKVALFLAIDSFPRFVESPGDNPESETVNPKLVLHKVPTPSTNLANDLFQTANAIQTDNGDHQQSTMVDEEDFELGISTAASIARHAIEQRCQAGLYVNSRLVHADGPIRIQPGSDIGQLVNMLEALARVTWTPSDPFDKFLGNERKRLPWGTTIILILHRPPESLELLVSNLRQHGYKLLVLQIGEKEPKSVASGVEWCRIKNPGDLQRINFSES